MSSLQLRAPVAAALMALTSVSAVHAQSHPDMTGVWSTPFRMHSSGLPLSSGSTPWMAVSPSELQKYPILTLDQYSAIADTSVKEHNGVPVFGQPIPPPPPFTPAGAAAAAAMTREKVEARSLNCAPGNAVDRAPGSPLQIVQNEKAIALMTEGGTPGRTVFMDRRSQADAIPQWNGLSVGHWRGRTLVVRTVAIRGDGFGFIPRLPIDENAVLTEEYTLRPDGQTLDVVTMLEDPTIYTSPLRKLVHLTRSPEVMVTDYTCIEGKEDMVEMQAKPGDDPGTGPGAPPSVVRPDGAPRPVGT